MKTLTAKQEKFCQNIALEGMNYSDAYRNSYNAGNMKDETINNNAYKLITENNEIKTRVKEIKDKIETKTIEKFSKSREQVLEKLESLITKAEEEAGKIEVDENGMYKLTGMKNENAIKEVRECLKEQAKLLGYYEDTINLKGQLNVVKGIRDFKNREKPQE